MLNHILGLILAAGIILPIVQPFPSPESELLRRAETVYVTVTEFRYVPINALPSQAPPLPQTDFLLAATPTIAQPALVVPPYTPTPSIQVLTPVQSTATPVSESTTNRVPPTPLVTTPPASHQPSTNTQSVENTDISTDTKESATTTSKDVTLSTTSVEMDGTTTVSTEHPTTTRSRGSQNTSGAQSGQSRGKIMRGPSIGSTLGYLGGLMAPSAGWQGSMVG
ncbi:hypothetical protein BG011_003374 [Mortierella polycephala]|uniref:Uncharacterized protein n=1 Tax=Mortierella polycephala TaxID=41804 RepID=A0A9P6U430_9FUNG|nr:hypothetical protein BG011_003374 [Mortierella polycephala]